MQTIMDKVSLVYLSLMAIGYDVRIAVGSLAVYFFSRQVIEYRGRNEKDQAAVKGRAKLYAMIPTAAVNFLGQVALDYPKVTDDWWDTLFWTILQTAGAMGIYSLAEAIKIVDLLTLWAKRKLDMRSNQGAGGPGPGEDAGGATVDILAGIVAVIALSAALWGYYHPQIRNVPGPKVIEYVNAEVPRPYAVITKQTVTVERVVVIEKEKVVTKEKWPDWFTGDKNQQLTAIGLVKPYRGDTECASVINLQSGESQIVTKRLPVPLFGFDNTMRVGATFGLGFEGHAEWSFARVGNFYAIGRGTYAQNGTDKAAVAGIGFNYEW
jgi:hypothetical protein